MYLERASAEIKVANISYISTTEGMDLNITGKFLFCFFFHEVDDF